MSKPKVGREMEILLVEDSLTDARLTIGALQRGDLKHRLTLVRDGQEAMDFLTRSGVFSQAPHPDLILLDLVIPKKSGMDVLSELQQDAELREIPVVVMTANETSEARQRCEAFHVKHYITKPVKLDRFLTVVRELRNHWRNDLILPPSFDQNLSP